MQINWNSQTADCNVYNMTHQEEFPLLFLSSLSCGLLNPGF